MLKCCSECGGMCMVAVLVKIKWCSSIVVMNTKKGYSGRVNM